MKCKASMGSQIFKTIFSSALSAALGFGLIVCPAVAQGPSFDCTKATGAVEEMICGDAELSALDRQLDAVYAATMQIAADERPPVLRSEQRGWIKGRNDCWKSDDTRKCVKASYRHRLAELQARYRLVPSKGPFGYFCNDNPRDELMVTFFQTDPPTLIAERGDQVSLMYLQPSASGSKYQGRNESFWEHHNEARVIWGYGSPAMHCQKR